MSPVASAVGIMPSSQASTSAVVSGCGAAGAGVVVGTTAAGGAGSEPVAWMKVEASVEAADTTTTTATQKDQLERRRRGGSAAWRTGWVRCSGGAVAWVFNGGSRLR